MLVIEFPGPVRYADVMRIAAISGIVVSTGLGGFITRRSRSTSEAIDSNVGGCIVT